MQKLHRLAKSLLLLSCTTYIADAKLVASATLDGSLTSQRQVSKRVNKDNSAAKASIDQQLLEQAKQDLARRLAVSAKEIKVLEVRAVVWPDTSLGCPEPGKRYDKISQAGFLIRLQYRHIMYFYHNADGQTAFLCPLSSRMLPHPERGDEFIPPPGIDID